jgi:trehalose 2-sulfotransferase
VRQHYDLATAAADLASGYRRPRRSVLVCTMRRCGSTLLGEALLAAGLGCPLEYFHPAWQPAFEARWHASDLRDYVAALYRHRTDSDGTLGVKLFWPDVLQTLQRWDPEGGDRAARLAADAPGDPARVHGEVAELLHALFPNPSVVFLWRQDRLRQAVSDLVAHQSGHWRRAPGDDADPAWTPAYDRRAIDRRLSQFSHELHAWRDCLDHLRLPVVEVAYEELAGDYRGTVRRVLRALLGEGWDGEVPPPRLRRQADDSSERLLLRYLRERRGEPMTTATTGATDP